MTAYDRNLKEKSRPGSIVVCVCAMAGRRKRRKRRLYKRARTTSRPTQLLHRCLGAFGGQTR